MGARRVSAASLLALLCVTTPAALGQHVSVWGGGGVGTFLAGSPTDVEGEKFGALAVAIAGDRLRLRYVRGSFEREKGVPSGVGDADVDSSGGDVVFTRALTRLPFDLGVGASLFKEARPADGRAGRAFDRRWGATASASREFPVRRPIVAWTELDLELVRFHSQQAIALFGAGLGLRF